MKVEELIAKIRSKAEAARALVDGNTSVNVTIAGVDRGTLEQSCIEMNQHLMRPGNFTHKYKFIYMESGVSVHVETREYKQVTTYEEA